MKHFEYIINGKAYHVTINKVDDTNAEVEVNGTRYNVLINNPEKKQTKIVKRPVPTLASTIVTPLVVPRTTSSMSGGSVKSPLPGIVISIDCKVGDNIKKGHTLLVLEAMKMENTIPSDRDGVVAEIKVNKGDTVLEGADLVILKAT